MTPDYSVQGVDIFVDGPDEKWREHVHTQVKNQVSGSGPSPAYVSSQRLTFYPYDELFSKGLITGPAVLITPEHTLLQGNILVSEGERIALKVLPNRIDIWVAADTWFGLANMLELLLLQRGMTFVHAAGVSISGRGVLLVAPGGTGKTAFISQAAKSSSITLLGDDLIIMDREGSLFPYHRPFCLYAYHRTLFPGFFNSHRVLYKQPTLFNRALRKGKGYLGLRDSVVYSYLPISPFALFERAKLETERVPLHAAYLVRRVKGAHRVSVVDRVSEERATSYALGIFLHEFTWLFEMAASLLMAPGAGYFTYAGDVSDIYRRAFRDKIIREIEIPETMGAVECASELVKAVLGLAS